MRILIADDDTVSRKLLIASLRGIECEIVEKENGEETWEYIQSSPGGLLITDWMMPKMSGLELVQKIRAANFESYTYIIMLTSRDGKSDIVEGLNAGPDDYLLKPYDLRELRARVNIGIRILKLESDLRSANDRLRYLSMHDPLTGLFNRRAIYDHLQSEINRVGHQNEPLHVGMLDIDYFKTINDTYGHQVGDSALRLLADKIQQSIRSYDWAGRWGGDEFLILFPHTNAEGAINIARRLQNSIGEVGMMTPKGTLIVLKISIGLYGYYLPEGEEIRPDMIIERADAALYKAKENGRGQIYIAPRG